MKGINEKINKVQEEIEKTKEYILKEDISEEDKKENEKRIKELEEKKKEYENSKDDLEKYLDNELNKLLDDGEKYANSNTSNSKIICSNCNVLTEEEINDINTEIEKYMERQEKYEEIKNGKIKINLESGNGLNINIDPSEISAGITGIKATVIFQKDLDKFYYLEVSGNINFINIGSGVKIDLNSGGILMENKTNLINFENLKIEIKKY